MVSSFTVASILCCLVIAHATDHPVPPPGPTDWTVFLLDKVEVYPELKQYNYLFRGNLPLLSNTEFNYDGLVEVLRSKAPDLPDNFFIVDISLEYESYPDNPQWVATEQQYFYVNYTQGSFYHWPLFGDIDDPNDWGSQLEHYALTLSQWQLDDLPGKMEQIRSMLTTMYDVPYVFYAHCHTGVDRTGEFSISYGMKYLNSSFQTEINFSDALCEKVWGRPIDPLQAFAAEWYCYYLYYAEGRTDLSCHLPN
eukprot:TRINITY_DN4706_c0_g1_i1.p1 TRINITY_DN4706_c0_g1~~TRINITY_DN4706_c0_g1_i1.p1  ORF type:complete len:252 (+),score=27.70 TRINITY_DN4706_c0_g1_i1:820-1575(+)